MKKTLAALVLGAGLLTATPASPIWMVDVDEPITAWTPQPDEVSYVGPVEVRKNKWGNPSWECWMKLTPYTTYSLPALPTYTPEQMIGYFRKANVPLEYLEKIDKSALQKEINFQNTLKVLLQCREKTYDFRDLGKNYEITVFDDCPQKRK